MISAAMSVVALKNFKKYPLVLINNEDKTGFCGFNINLNFMPDYDDYEKSCKKIQSDVKEILSLVTREDIREHLDDEMRNNVPEGTELSVDIFRIEGIAFTKDCGPGALREAYPDLHEFIKDNFKVKELKYTPFGMTIFYQVELKNKLKVKL